MTILPKGDWSIPGTWVPHLREDHREGAIVICPKCGKGSVLVAKIETEGHYHGLSLSFVCPHKPCDFKDDVKLMWWNLETVKK